MEQFEVPPRFELGSLDSKSRVRTVTPQDLVCPMSKVTVVGRVGTNFLPLGQHTHKTFAEKLSYSHYVCERDPKQQVKRKWTEKRRDRVEMVVEWGTVQWIRLKTRLKMKLFLMTRPEMLPWLGRGLALSQKPFPWPWVEQMLIWNLNPGPSNKQNQRFALRPRSSRLSQHLGWVPRPHGGWRIRRKRAAENMQAAICDVKCVRLQKCCTQNADVIYVTPFYAN